MYARQQYVSLQALQYTVEASITFLACTRKFLGFFNTANRMHSKRSSTRQRQGNDHAAVHRE
jgi:hypothetical protein